MAHIRQQLRNAAEGSMATAFPGFAFRKGANFASSADDLPECGVIAPVTSRGNEDVDTADHSIDIVVLARVVIDDDALDHLDAVAVVAVPVITQALAGVIDDVDLVREDQVVTELGSDSIAVHQLTFRCVANTPKDNPEILSA